MEKESEEEKQSSEVTRARRSRSSGVQSSDGDWSHRVCRRVRHLSRPQRVAVGGRAVYVVRGTSLQVRDLHGVRALCKIRRDASGTRFRVGGV